MSKFFNITPKPRMLLGVQNQKWNVSGAVAELIDNAFGPGRGRAKSVKIIYDSGTKTLTITDDGRGMEYIGRLFQLGNTVGHTANDIGHFGSGGTQAIIWLADWVQVATGKRNGKIMSDRIRWSEVFDKDDFSDIKVANEWRNGNFRQFSEWDYGTAIHIKLLKTRKLTTSNLIRDLSKLFAPGLRSGKRITWCHVRNGTVVDEFQLTDPFEVKAAPENTVRFDITMEYGNEHLPVRGEVTFNDETSHANSVVRIGMGYREIMRTRDCYRRDDKSYAGLGVSGWLDLGDGWQQYLSTTKDGIDDEVLKEALMEHVFEQILPLLKKSDEKTIDFELENIALNLQFALEKATKTKVEVNPKGEVTIKTGRRNGDPNPEPPIGPGNANETKGDVNPEGERETPAATVIHLWKQTDDKMMGALAKAGEDPTGLYVDINKDHFFVTEALRQKPVNRAALNLMIVSEIAGLLVDTPTLIKRAFKQPLIDELDRCETDGDKVRKVVRLLIDSVPGKHQAAE